MTANDIMDQTMALRSKGQIVQLKHMMVDIGSRGRPKGALEADSVKRAKSFLEEIHMSDKFVADVLNKRGEFSLRACTACES